MIAASYFIQSALRGHNKKILHHLPFARVHFKASLRQNPLFLGPVYYQRVLNRQRRACKGVLYMVSSSPGTKISRLPA